MRVNCAVLGDELFESELFGHAKGAFTGAGQDRKGLLELSSGGTVFLDEVAELAPRAQAKLLRVLQDGEIRRLGENRTQRLDLWVVAATNRPLDAEAAEGRFRKDPLYRLHVVGLTAPPLRERGPDVALLAEHCWKGVAEAAGSRATLARDGGRAGRAPVAGQRAGAAERARQPDRHRTPLRPGRPRRPAGRLTGRPPPPSGSRRSPRRARTSNARWSATPSAATVASPAPPASWASPARVFRS